MEDFSRCYAVPPLPPPSISPLDDGRSSSFNSAIELLSSRCWSHYENSGDARHRHSLYLGSLGPCAYVRYRLAQSLSWDVGSEGERKRRLLHDVSRAADNVVRAQSMARGRSARVTFLEGGRVGALALSAAAHHSLHAAEGDGSHLSKASRAKSELLDVVGTGHVRALPASECEVLYGRAGYLHAIAFVRSETNDEEFGKVLVMHIVKQILREGERVANKNGLDFPFMWTWHRNAYLGAIHGVAGILFTLLCFHEEVSLVEGALEKIKIMITKLDDLCFPSGNLKSSLGAEKDKLVHLCHGAPGHILLLVKAYEVLGDQLYLERAEEITTNIICRRGLLKKGVGLCHGISGNAYCFLALYRGRILSERRNGDALNTRSDKWLRWAHHFAGFAVENLADLFWIPDHPHSLYEGASGLIMLLHDLKDPGRSHFPCFEPRS